MILLILFENLPFPFSTFYLYFLLFIGFLVIFKPIVFTEKTNKHVLFFAIFYFLFYLLGIYKPSDAYNLNWLFISELMPILIATLFFAYFIITNDYKNLIIIIRFLLVFIFITAITSIIGLTFFPDAARGLAGPLAQNQEFELIRLYQRIGIAGYDFYYGLAFSMPVFIFLVKKHWDEKIKRYILLLFILTILYAIIKSQLTTSFLFSLLAIAFSVFGGKSIKKSFLYLIITLIIIIFIPTQFYADTIRSISTIVPGETLQGRLKDLSITIENLDQDIKQQETHVSKRAERIPYLLNNFKQSPIIGGGKSTGHNFWLDRLSLFGIIGFIPWIILLNSIIKQRIRKIRKEYVYYFLLSITLLIAIGFLKNSGGKILYLLVFFMVPSILTIYSNNKDIFQTN